MTLDEARSRHSELSEKLLDAKYRYYVLDSPTLSDIEYDTDMRELEALAPDSIAFLTPSHLHATAG